jgi:DNA-binding NtrC family response regulator
LTKILIIDDDQMMLNALTTLLETEEQTTVTAKDAESGISMYRQQKPDAVLLDLRLPTKDGIEVLKEIRLINANAKVIIITGYPTPEAREEAMANGAFFFYEKSKDIGELVSALAKALTTTFA